MPERPPLKGHPLQVCVVCPTLASRQGQSTGPRWELAIGLLVGASNRACVNGVGILLYTISQDLPRPLRFEKKSSMQPTRWQPSEVVAEKNGEYVTKGESLGWRGGE
jgi:hypothetical protein